MKERKIYGNILRDVTYLFPLQDRRGLLTFKIILYTGCPRPAECPAYGRFLM